MSNKAGIDVKDLLVVSKKRKAKMTPEEKVEKAERLAKERNERSNAKRRKPNLTYGNFSGSSSGPAVRKPWTRKSNLVVPAVVLIEEADHSTSAAGEESSIVNNGSSNFVVEEAELSVPSAGNEDSVVTPELNNCVPKESELPMSSAAEEASAVLEKLSKQQEQPKQSKESLFHVWKSKQQTIYGSLIDSYTINQNVCGICKSICANGILKCCTSSRISHPNHYFLLNSLTVMELSESEGFMCRFFLPLLVRNATVKIPVAYSEALRYVMCSREKLLKHLIENEYKKHKGMCGNSEFKAAQEVSSQRKNLDVAGNMMVSCGHATILTSVDMKESESYRHTLLLARKVLKERNCKFLVNDVVCHFWFFLASLAVLLPKAFGDFTQRLIPFLSRLHGQAHAWYCQIIYFGHWKDGAGGTLGEEQEQVFSTFSRYCNVTKYMSRASRNDFLTMAMFYWNSRKEAGLPLFLTKRLLNSLNIVNMLDNNNNNIEKKNSKVYWKLLLENRDS
ncbi:hypothetical protein OUZ56_032885 [Daphnia magna]|uniref:Uncharacterized protein n=1 Tax=Daphnia magna TaxID=35525 RepID=A0ABR0B9U1_9CRUS|nr:hypothetical protein OUZ56_032885 [Daphnia magna]